jgi:three-Cys-motif partner protein
MACMSRERTDISEIGNWSIVKLDIIREYAAAYSINLAAQRNPRLAHIYIDAFAGAGFHVARESGDLVWGSPSNALVLDPPFTEYHFIDLDRGSIDSLREIVQSRTTGPYDPASVHLYNADCNEILVRDVFPRARYEEFRRGLCLLDPYGLHLDWQVMETAGKMRSIEIFLNFPILDMNRNVLLRDPESVSSIQIERMNRFWGDESWKEVAYSRSQNLFGLEEKTSNEAMVEAFRERLKKVAEFSHVSAALPMKNTTGAVVYYLVFAAQKPVASKIVKDILRKYAS